MAVSVLIGMQGRNIAIAFGMMFKKKKKAVLEKELILNVIKDFMVIECKFTYCVTDN